MQVILNFPRGKLILLITLDPFPEYDNVLKVVVPHLEHFVPPEVCPNAEPLVLPQFLHFLGAEQVASE